MSGSPGYRLEIAPSFEASILAFEKEHYKKDGLGKSQLRDLLVTTTKSLYDFPTVAGCRQERFPEAVKANCVGWEMHKVEFSAPRQAGAARQGRYVFLVNRVEKLIVPLYVYSHGQFKMRIPDAPLAQLVKAVTGEIVAAAKPDKK